MSGENENVRFEAEILETEGLNPHVQVMLIRECTNFVTTFAGEWLRNVEIIAENGFTVNEDGHLVCGREHFKDSAADLGKFILFPNLMAVGQAIMAHNINVTHKDEEPIPHRVPPVENRGSFRNGSTCGPDCPTHAHTHYRKVL